MNHVSQGDHSPDTVKFYDIPPTLVDLLPMLCNQFRAHILNRATDTVHTSLEMFTMTSAEKSSKRGRRPTTAY